MLSTRMQGAAFAPNHLPNLQLWLDAADVATIAESSGAVSQWDDKSGQENHAMQGTGSAQPTTSASSLAGRNVIDFTTNDYLTIASFTSIMSLSSAFSTFMVFRLNVDDVSPKTLLASSVSGSDRTIMQVDNRSLTCGTYNGSSWEFNSTSFTETANAHLVQMNNSSSNSITPYLDRTELTATIETPASSDTAATRIGARTNGSFNFEGSIAEVLVFSRELESAESAQLNQYLASKWGVSFA